MRLPRFSLSLAAVIALIALLPALASADPLDEATRRVARQMQCPVCEGQTVADSGSGLAQDMRAVIRTRLESGDTEPQILDSFVASYGESILTDPPKSGGLLGLWLVPPLAVSLGALVWYVLTRAWQRRSPPSPADRVVGSPPGPARREVDATVEEELRRFRQEAQA